MRPRRPSLVRRSLLFVFVLTVALGPAAASRAHARVILIGIDGGSWNVLEPMLRSGDLPHLAKLIASGFHADLDTVEPLISPVVWTSIATGRSPVAHGIQSFGATRADVRVPSIFARLSAQRVRVGLYDYLMTWPPPTFAGGFAIPGWLRRDPSVTPADVWARAGVEPFVASYDGLRTNADYLALSRREVATKGDRFVALLERFDVDLAAVTFYAVDMTAHRFWHAAYPGAFAKDEYPELERVTDAEARALRDAVVGIDSAIGKIVARLGPNDVVVVVSDHGFQAQDAPDVRWVTQLPPLLARAGLDPKRDGFTIVSTFGLIGLGIPGGPFAEREPVYARLVEILESLRTPDGSPLYRTYRLDVADRPETAKRSIGERLRQWAVRTYIDWALGVELDPSLHAAIFCLPNADLLAETPASTPIAVPGGTLPLGEILTGQRFTGAHHPTGIFIASGGPIAQRSERGRVSVLDVAPLLSYLVGRPIPGDLEHALRTDLIEPASLAARPPRVIAADAIPIIAPARPDDPSGPEKMSPELREKLRSLGYAD